VCQTHVPIVTRSLPWVAAIIHGVRELDEGPGDGPLSMPAADGSATAIM
jgi:hypothetical protein